MEVRRGFDHLVAEASVAAGRLLPRYALWLRLRELGFDPERLTRDEALAFCRAGLRDFLREHCVALPEAARRRMERRVARFDPRQPTPEERLARL
jgi:hypothetical protein